MFKKDYPFKSYILIHTLLINIFFRWFDPWRTYLTSTANPNTQLNYRTIGSTSCLFISTGPNKECFISKLNKIKKRTIVVHKNVSQGC